MYFCRPILFVDIVHLKAVPQRLSPVKHAMWKLLQLTRESKVSSSVSETTIYWIFTEHLTVEYICSCGILPNLSMTKKKGSCCFQTRQSKWINFKRPLCAKHSETNGHLFYCKELNRSLRFNYTLNSQFLYLTLWLKEIFH